MTLRLVIAFFIRGNRDNNIAELSWQKPGPNFAA